LWNFEDTPDAIYFIAEGRVQLIADKFQIYDSLDPSLLKNKIISFNNRYFAFKEMVKGSFMGEIEIL
jgi:CRP-like cAMP-binding protein